MLDPGTKSLTIYSICQSQNIWKVWKLSRIGKCRNIMRPVTVILTIEHHRWKEEFKVSNKKTASFNGNENYFQSFERKWPSSKYLSLH